MTPTPDRSQKPGSTDIALDRILNSLEYSLGKFHQHHQETLEVHQQYLHYQLRYAETFFQLIQQQHQLWANVQNSPREVEVKTAVIASAERCMLDFQKHQSNTLRVHEQYLNHQAQYAQNFFLLTQQSYAQLLLGDSKLDASNAAIAHLDYQLDEPLVLSESISATPEEVLSNGNGHYKVANLLETATVNGNQHYTQSKSVETSVESKIVQFNGHHPANLVADEAVLPSVDTVTVVTLASEIDFTALSETLIDVVSEKTGYPPEMLELDMDMEADLGIDSIKRVEILGALQEEMPNLPQPNLADLGDLRTLNQIIEYLRSFDRQTTAVESVADETQPESIAEIFLKIVSEKTGYPVPSLNLEMNLQADLGIDAVKRREIFDSLQKQMSLMSLPTSVEQSETLTQVIDYLKLNQTQKKTPISAMAR